MSMVELGLRDSSQVRAVVVDLRTARGVVCWRKPPPDVETDILETYRLVTDSTVKGGGSTPLPFIVEIVSRR
ncbi:hypothetical protein V6N11_075158 [Hibiscus sabdariffa]|uniref:Uncharacterized protein n=1 Tax=Hibiscus sabdariffa TaxID=183260 RepID=A0ABR2R649_9ROSI